jgi:hypothetical protein
MTKRYFILLLSFLFIISVTNTSCGRKQVGCPNDMYNNFNKNKKSNPNGKKPKPKKGGDKGVVPY